MYQENIADKNMDMKNGMLAVIGICVLVLLIGVLRQKAEILLNFVVRSILGVIAIYSINMVLAQMGISHAVGINPISVLTMGSLGTGGLGLLYGILFYNIL